MQPLQLLQLLVVEYLSLVVEYLSLVVEYLEARKLATRHYFRIACSLSSS
jgi:hypothetical protein